MAFIITTIWVYEYLMSLYATIHDIHRAAFMAHLSVGQPSILGVGCWVFL